MAEPPGLTILRQVCLRARHRLKALGAVSAGPLYANMVRCPAILGGLYINIIGSEKMIDRNDRKARIAELSSSIKEANRKKYSVVFKECIDALGNDVQILTCEESELIYDELQRLFPFTSWGRIDWKNVRNKSQISSVSELVDLVTTSPRWISKFMLYFMGFGK